MFEITKEDIQQLSDKDLRELVGKLCEAELRKQNIPSVYVTYGGKQDATDGGIDVSVRIENKYSISGFIPRNYTGIQVKVPKMTVSEIKKEMRPNECLRDSIKEIADYTGSYIIVSAQDDTSATMLSSRIAAMKKAASDYPAGENLKLDFYDCQRIATWVNGHASIILWVHIKTGTSSSGWEPFSNWSNAKGNINDEYFINGVKLINVGCKGRYNELSAVEGINHIRQSLNTTGVSVRIVGLSGVGKTRLAQALCDNRIGVNAINQDCIVYTDLSHSPNPLPQTMIKVLSVRNEKTVLIVDNCAPDLHRILSEICKKGNGNVSLLTIEYDIQTDQAEEVEVYKLEPSSIKLIEQILQLRYKHLGQISISRIAEFSGGNARIALALASELQTGDDIATFNDNQLFSRLFWQGRSLDNELLSVAKACSVVYSFNIEEQKELDILAQIADISIKKLYSNTQELIRRGLMQRRGKWRAVLPHALANWLANRAIVDMPINYLQVLFEESEELRLLCSFSKRLGFLPKNETVENIIANWLSDDGLLKNITILNDISVRIFMNIAPVNIEKTLIAIEQVESHENALRFFSSDNPYCHTIIDILCAIAYDTTYFERCVKLLIRFSLSEKKNRYHNTIRDKIKGLFQMHLSGTHASPELRLTIIDRLIKKGGAATELGFDLLESALKTMRFIGHFPINFGAWNRDAGYYPVNRDKIKAWYTCFINYMQGLLHDNSTAEKTKKLLADKLQGLLRAGMIDEINNFADIALAHSEWGFGWISLKGVLHTDRKKIPKDMLTKLESLEKKLAPKSVFENARATLLSSTSQSLYFCSENEESTRLKEVAYSIAYDEDAIKRLIPEILCSSNLNIGTFAAALAEKCNNPKRIWAVFIEQYALKEKSQCYPYQLLGGFLRGLNSERPRLVEELLEEAVENELAYVFPLIQTSVPITKQGAKRIIRSISNGSAPLEFYSSISSGRAHETIDDKNLCKIIRLLATTAEGIKAAIQIYHMRIYEKTIEDISDEILELGFEILLKYNFTDDSSNDHVSYMTSHIAELCFSSEDFNAMQIQCEKLKREILDDYMGAYGYNSILTVIAKTRPMLFLNTFLEFTDEVPSRIAHALISNYVDKPVLNVIKDKVLQNWCEIKPQPRYMLVASVIQPYTIACDKWVWKPIAIQIIKNVSEQRKAVDLLMSNCLSNSTWSLFSDYYRCKTELLEALSENVDQGMQEYLQQKITENQKQYRIELEREKADNEYGFE